MNTNAVIVSVALALALAFGVFYLGTLVGESKVQSKKMDPFAVSLRCPSCNYSYSITVEPKQ